MNEDACVICLNKPEFRSSETKALYCKQCVLDRGYEDIVQPLTSEKKKTLKTVLKNNEHYCEGCKKIHEATEWTGIHTPFQWYCGRWIKHGPRDDRTNEMVEDGKKNAKDMIQRWRGDELSREFVETYPKQVQGMLKEGAITKDQVEKANYVWKQDVKGLDTLPYEGIGKRIANETSVE